MGEAFFYLASSFWAGAVHAATPGHGKTISAAYIVGAHGRPVDAVILGVFVTLSHTSGILLVGLLASLGSAWLVPQRIEAYLALIMGVLVIGLGGFLLWTQRRLIGLALGAPALDHRHQHVSHNHAHTHTHAPAHHHGPDAHGHRHARNDTHTHAHAHEDHAHTHHHDHRHDDHAHTHHDHDHVHDQPRRVGGRRQLWSSRPHLVMAAALTLWRTIPSGG